MMSIVFYTWFREDIWYTELMTETTFLFGNPSFISWLWRTLDMGGTFDEYNRTEDPDTIAIANDWIAVWKDISSSIKKYSHA